MEIGSIWNRWDLHVHSPASFHNNYTFSDQVDKDNYDDNIWEKYIDELEQIDGVSVIGITDYYSIDGYKIIKKYQIEERLKNFKLILPNIEFRSDILVSGNGSSKKINFHIIFSDKLSINEIEEEFLQSINIWKPNGEPRRLNTANIERIGRELSERHKPFQKMNNDYRVGAINIYVKLNEVLDILESKKSIFGGKYIFVLSEALWGDLGWDGQDHLLRKQLFIKCNALFSSNPSTIDWALGKKDDYTNFVAEFGRPKPCIHGSDAHSFSTLCKPDLDRFCWLKSDCTFEGLKQIIYEPSERVKISKNNPESTKSIYTLSKIHVSETFVDDKLTVNEIKIPLNRNLVTIIGGKGTGKTALLDIIANCFIDQCFRQDPEKKRENSFIQRIEDIAGEMKNKIEFIDPEIEIFEKSLVEEKFFSKSKISYLPQGQIEQFCGDEDKLEEKIIEIIFSNREVIDSGLIDQYNDILRGINTKETEIRNVNLDIFNLEKSTTNEIVSEINRKKQLTEGELEDKGKLLKVFITQNRLEEEGVVKSLREKENNLKVEHSDLISLNVKLDSLTKEFDIFSKNLNKSIHETNSRLSNLSFSIKIPEIIFREQLDVISDARNSVENKLTEKIKDIDKISTQILQLDGLQKEQSEILKEIDESSQKIISLEGDLTDIKIKREQIKELEETRKKKYISIIKYLFKLKNCYQNIISLFSKGKNEILDELDFQPKISLKSASYLEKANDLFHGKKVKDDEFKLFDQNLLTLIQDESEIETNVNSYLSFSFDYKNKIKQSRNSEEFYNLIFLNPYKILTDIYYNERPMEKLSIGQKGTVLLKLMLAEGDYPLLIDQPEENLDNNFIYNDLVKAIRDAKNNRQIILATHNANLVVNTDAEQIIVANYIDNKIFYNSGSIENLTIKNEITSLLEGGEEAFKKREEKYGF